MTDQESAPQAAPLSSNAVEAGILERLTEPDDQRPWSVDELARDLGHKLAVRDAVVNLHGLGLVHRCGELVFPTRAALHAERVRT